MNREFKYKHEPDCEAWCRGEQSCDCGGLPNEKRVDIKKPKSDRCGLCDLPWDDCFANGGHY